MDGVLVNAVRDIALALVSAWTLYQETRIRKMCETCPYHPKAVPTPSD